MKKILTMVATCFLACSVLAQTAPTTAATTPTTLSQGTPLKVKLETTISTFSSKVGDPFQGKISEPVVLAGKPVIPAGAVVEGRVTRLSEPRRIKGKPTIGILPEYVVMPDGQRIMLNAVLVDTNIPGTDVNEEGLFKGPGHERMDQILVAGGTGAGMLIGGLIGGGPGVVIGGAIGAGTTTTRWLIKKGSAVLPSGAQLTFELSRPMVMSNNVVAGAQQ